MEPRRDGLPHRRRHALHPTSDLRAGFPRFTVDAREANLPIVDLLRRVGERHGATPAQVALTWLLAQRPWIVPIPGTTRPEHLEEDLGTLAVELTPHDLQEIETGFGELGVRGERMSPELRAGIDEGASIGTSSAGGHGLSPLPA